MNFMFGFIRFLNLGKNTLKVLFNTKNVQITALYIRRLHLEAISKEEAFLAESSFPFFICDWSRNRIGKSS